MPRCTRITNLQVHHKRRDGGNGLDNAEVLCLACHSKGTSTYGVPGQSPKPFGDATKQEALKRARNQCECTRIGGCH